MDADCPARITALGMVNNLGGSVAEIAPRIFAGDQTGFTTVAELVPGQSFPAARVTVALPEIPARLSRYRCRNNALSLQALRPIEQQIAAARRRYGRHRLGVVMGTSTSGTLDGELAIRRHFEAGALPESFDYALLELGGAALFLAEYLDISGPAYVASTACSSSAHALASARALLRADLCDAVVAGGTDSLCALTLNGFAALQALDPGVCNSFSRHRRGLNLGEGSALFLLERERGEVEIRGVGQTTEAHHMSAPDPAGEGAAEAMRQALADAGVRAAEIAYLNLHGTGTPLNDAMESRAVARVLGTNTACSSTKPLVGHTLGAAGAMEAAICTLALQCAANGRLPLPPHRFDGARDPDLEPIRLAGPGEQVPPGPVLSNSFGFGGNNCSLVLARSTP